VRSEGPGARSRDAVPRARVNALAVDGRRQRRWRARPCGLPGARKTRIGFSYHSGAGWRRGGRCSFIRVAVAFSLLDGDGAAERRRAAQRSGDALQAAKREECVGDGEAAAAVARKRSDDPARQESYDQSRREGGCRGCVARQNS